MQSGGPAMRLGERAQQHRIGRGRGSANDQLGLDTAPAQTDWRDNAGKMRREVCDRDL